MLLGTRKSSVEPLKTAYFKRLDAKYGDYLRSINSPIPVILTNEGEVVREVHSFLLEKSTYSRSSNAAKTVETYGHCLYIWLKYCAENKLDWRLTTPKSLINYRNFMKAGVGSRAKALKPNTINLRMTVVMEFLKYFLNLSDLNSESTAGSMSRLAKIQSVNFFVRRSKTFPIALSPAECTQIFTRLADPHRLIFMWGLSTGLRISTLLSIKLSAYYAAKGVGESGFIGVSTKGGKQQTVYVPKHLTEATDKYISIDRRIRELRGGGIPNSYLFLNHNGKEVTRGCYYAAYKRACKHLRLNSHPHQARTTFATFIEKKLREYGKANSLDHVKIVQGLLGHSSAATTELYLESLQVQNFDVLTIIDSVVGASEWGF